MIIHLRNTTRATPRGFTLLEMVIVLSIIAAIATMAVLEFGNVEEEQRLRESIGAVESLARRGRNIAFRQQRAYLLTISEGSVSIGPQYANWNDGDGDDEADVGMDKKFEDIIDVEQTDGEVMYEVKRWGSDEWQVIEKDIKVVVTIDPTGLVEPISIRCSVGKSWIIQELHPLTAGVRNEEMNIERD